MTNRVVDFNDNIVIVNPKQAAFYWEEKKIHPVHIYPSRDKNTNEPIIIFVFQRSATQDAYKEWVERK
jgi:hypothetical protein